MYIVYVAILFLVSSFVYAIIGLREWNFNKMLFITHQWAEYYIFVITIKHLNPDRNEFRRFDLVVKESLQQKMKFIQIEKSAHFLFPIILMENRKENEIGFKEDSMLVSNYHILHMIRIKSSLLYINFRVNYIFGFFLFHFSCKIIIESNLIDWLRLCTNWAYSLNGFLYA